MLTLKKAVSRNPDAADMRVNYVLALVKTGKREAAREELRRLVASGKAVSLVRPCEHCSIDAE